MAIGETFEDQVLDYITKHPGCDRAQMELDLTIHKSGIAFSIRNLEESDQVCHVEEQGRSRGRHYFYYPGKEPPASDQPVSKVFMHLSENPWLTIKEISGDLEISPERIYRECQVMVRMGVLLKRRRKDPEENDPTELDVKPGVNPPLQADVEKAIDATPEQFPRDGKPPKAAKSPATKPAPKAVTRVFDDEKLNREFAPNAPIVLTTRYLRAELQTPKGRIVLEVPDFCPAPDVQKAIDILKAAIS